MYFPPSLGMMPDANEVELNAYQPGNAESKFPLGIRPFVQQPAMCEALRALVGNKNQMIEEATVVPGDCGNFRSAAAGWTKLPICTRCNDGCELSMLLSRPTRIMTSLGRLKVLSILQSLVDSNSDYRMKEHGAGLKMNLVYDTLKKGSGANFSTNVVKGLYEYCFFAGAKKEEHLMIVNKFIDLEKKMLSTCCKNVRHGDKTYRDLPVPEVSNYFPHDPLEVTFTHGRWQTFEKQYENQLKVAWTETEVLAYTILCPYSYLPLIIDFKMNSDGETESVLDHYYNINLLAPIANRLHC